MATTRHRARAGGVEVIPRPLFDLVDLFRWPEGWLTHGWQSSMRIEEYEEDGAFVVRAELPGIDPDKDVDITVDEGILTITAERRERTTGEEKGWYHSEMRYGSFERSFQLPVGADDTSITAGYKDGILEVRVALPPKAEARKGTRIPVAHE